MSAVAEPVNPVDAWIDAIPEDKYAPCPCGCGKKWRFAVVEGIEKHEQRFMERLQAVQTGGKVGGREHVRAVHCQ
jgi:hypothetical protein